MPHVLLIPAVGPLREHHVDSLQSLNPTEIWFKLTFPAMESNFTTSSLVSGWVSIAMIGPRTNRPPPNQHMPGKTGDMVLMVGYTIREQEAEIDFLVDYFAVFAHRTASEISERHSHCSPSQFLHLVEVELQLTESLHATVEDLARNKRMSPTRFVDTLLEQQSDLFKKILQVRERVKTYPFNVHQITFAWVERRSRQELLRPLGAGMPPTGGGNRESRQ